MASRVANVSRFKHSKGKRLPADEAPASRFAVPRDRPSITTKLIRANYLFAGSSLPHLYNHFTLGTVGGMCVGGTARQTYCLQFNFSQRGADEIRICTHS